MNDKELMQQALDALNHVNVQDRVQIITALRERLAQPERELVCVCGAIWEGQELVSTPPQRTWVGLTDEEIEHIADSEWGEAFVRMIEAKLKEKNKW